MYIFVIYIILFILMKIILPQIFRILINLLIVNKYTYLMAMLIVRLSRKIRNLNKTSIPEFLLVKNCMGKIKMYLDHTSYMGGSLYWTGYHHINESLYLKKIIKTDMNFVDIGANQGEFSLLACSLIQKGKVISFEPVDDLNSLLTKNIKANNFKNIEINHYGLSDKVGTLPIFNSKKTKNNNEGLSSLYSSENRSEFLQNVELKVFDEEYFQILDRLDFIKIDIEGAELYALKGMQKSINKFKPIILIEICEDMFDVAGYSLDDILIFFKELNYEAFKLFRGNLIKYNGDFKGLGNYIFKPIK